MTPLQQLRAAIIATNEDIMKLQFGCEGYVKNDVRVRVFGVDGRVIFHTPQVNGVNTVFEEDFIILGRKIGIADVLLAIEKARPSEILQGHTKEARGSGWAIRATGQLIWLEYAYEYHGRDASWNLSQDDLNLQSEETITFLHSILCKK